MRRWRTRRGVVPSLALGVMLSGLASGLAPAHSLKELEDKLAEREAYVQIVDRPAPPFALRDFAGSEVSLAGLRGKVVVLYFIYAGCPDLCPLHSSKIADTQAKVNRTPMRALVEFVAITTDPEDDTPEILEAYGPARGLDPVNWVFLTGGADKPAVTSELLDSYGLKFTPTGNGYQVHAAVTHLIDKSGNLRGRYHGLRFDATNMILHINALTNDDH